MKPEAEMDGDHVLYSMTRELKLILIPNMGRGMFPLKSNI